MGPNRFDFLKQADITLLVGCPAIVSLLGFFSFLQAVKQISALADGISKMQEGRIDALQLPVHKREVHEVAKIRKALASIMMSELGCNAEKPCRGRPLCARYVRHSWPHSSILHQTDLSKRVVPIV